MEQHRRAVRSLLVGLGLMALLAPVAGQINAEEALPQAPEELCVTGYTGGTDGPAAAPADGEAGPLASESLDAAAGQRAFIDPQTGILTVPPAKARRQGSMHFQDLFSTSHEGLQVIRLDNGLAYVNLKGRLFSATLATVGEDGAVRIHHGLPTPPETAAQSGGAADVDGGEDRP